MDEGEGGMFRENSILKMFKEIHFILGLFYQIKSAQLTKKLNIFYRVVMLLKYACIYLKFQELYFQIRSFKISQCRVEESYKPFPFSVRFVWKKIIKLANFVYHYHYILILLTKCAKAPFSKPKHIAI